jgi:murein DD-endopeptidase MepM/ murein hydrolase activator NlpD
MAGTVLHRSSNSSLGNFIIIQHGDHQTLYAHLSAFGVAVGQAVRQGQEIGKVGSTGRSTGPHLHFAVFRNGEPINPIDLLR